MAASDAAFRVLGLHCPSCALRLEKVLATAAGVVAARVDFLRATALVQADDRAASPLDVSALVARADAAGFRLEPHPREPPQGQSPPS
jgi:copper chaperone CopZ